MCTIAPPRLSRRFATIAHGWSPDICNAPLQARELTAPSNRMCRKCCTHRPGCKVVKEPQPCVAAACLCRRRMFNDLPVNAPPPFNRESVGRCAGSKQGKHARVLRGLQRTVPLCRRRMFNDLPVNASGQGAIDSVFRQGIRRVQLNSPVTRRCLTNT